MPAIQFKSGLKRLLLLVHVKRLSVCGTGAPCAYGCVHFQFLQIPRFTLHTTLPTYELSTKLLLATELFPPTTSSSFFF